MQKISITESFPSSVEKLFQYLEVHENLESIFFPIKVKTIQAGKTEKFGVGSVRSLQLGPIPGFEETITDYVKNKRIEYKITKGSPLKNHLGVIQFSSNSNGSQLHYTIEFDSDIPLLANIVKFGLEKGIRDGLKKLKKQSI